MVFINAYVWISYCVFVRIFTINYEIDSLVKSVANKTKIFIIGGIVIDLFLTYHWEVFITIEVLLILSILLFGLFRYFLDKNTLSKLFIGSFFLLLGFEALLGLYVYQQTGEVSTFIIVIMIFLIYACTFGIIDFIRLDRWMRDKIGKLRGIELLTEKDYRIMERNNNPRYLAKKYRITSTIHLIIFVIAQSIFWSMGTDTVSEAIGYLTDFSWINDGVAEGSPYPNDVVFGIGIIWGIVFIVD